MLLAGVDDITIAPAILRELADTQVDAEEHDFPSLFDRVEANPEMIPQKLSYLENEEGFRMAMTRDKGGMNEVKLVQVCGASAGLSDLYT